VKHLYDCHRVKCGMLVLTAACGWLVAPPSARSQEANLENGGEQTHAKSAAHAAEEPEHNAVILDVTGGASYNDNVFANNLDRVHDTLFDVGGSLGLYERRSRFDIALMYRPNLIVSRQFSAYDQVNHDVSFQGTYRATPHLDLELRDTTDYYRGIFETPVAETPFSPAAPPPSLNDTVFTPLVSEFSNQTRIDLVDRLTPNGTADAFGTFEDRTFGKLQNLETLFNTISGAAGLTYTYRLNRAWSVAASYSFQALAFGSSSQAAFHNASLNVTWNATPTLAIAAFGGPQRADLYETLADQALITRKTATSPIDLQHWYAAYGASITKEIQHFQFQLSGQRIATDGGGVQTGVINTQEDLQLRWLISEHWEARLTGENSNTRSLSPTLSNGQMQSQRVGFVMVRRFTPRLSAKFGYDYTRQRVGGQLPFFFNMDRNLVSFSVTYRVADFLLGR
jgi:hypothetical protein